VPGDFYAKTYLPNFRYFPAALMEDCGPREWARIRLIQACERLDIDRKLWPKLKVLRSPGKLIYEFISPSFKPPDFDAFTLSPKEWFQLASVAFRKFCDEFTSGCISDMEQEVKAGRFVAIAIPRGESARRYEWAAKRYCLKLPYKDMASAAHSPEKIRQSVSRIFREAGIKNVT
jgi:hypothetical protein